MKTQIKINGIIIRTIDYDESSKICHLLTEEGIISVLAKGCRRIKSKFLNFPELLNEVEVIITNSTLPVLIDYTVLNQYQNIKDDLKRLLWFYYIFEIINKLPNDIKYKNTYRLLKRILNLGDKENPMLLALIFQIKALALFGVSPEFNECVVCHRKEIVSFSVSKGGALCKFEKSNRSDFDIFLAMKKCYYFDIYNANIKDLNDIDLKKLFNLVTEYYNYHVEIKLHSINSVII